VKRRVEGMERPGRRALGYLHQAGQGDTRSETALKQTWHNGKEAAKDDDLQRLAAPQSAGGERAGFPMAAQAANYVAGLRW